MNNQEQALLAYIKKEEEKGFDEPKIREALLKAGYKQEMIDEVFYDYKIDSNGGLEDEPNKQKIEIIEKSEEKTNNHVNDLIQVTNNKNPKKHWLRFAIICGLLCIAVFLYIEVFYLNPSIDNSDLDNTTEDIIVNQESKIDSNDLLNYCEGSFNKDITQCRKITDEQFKAECSYNAAMIHAFEKKSSALCYYIPNPFYKSICLNTVKEKITSCGKYCDVVNANIAKDPILCKSENKFCKDTIKLWHAKQNKDANACNSFEDSEDQKLCNALVRNNVMECKVIS